jgi:predicted RND superfamily exporter protein
MMPVVYRWVEFRQESDLTDALIDAATRVLAEKHPQANLRVRLTGRVPILQTVEQSFTSNQLKFQIIGYVLVVVLSVFLFRGWRAVFIVGAAPVMGIFWSLGLLDFFQFQRNSLTSIVMPVLVMMVGMTDGIHMMLHIRRNQAAGLDRLQAVRDAIVRVGPACALTSLTTAIGFASLLLAQSEFIRNFGKGCMWAVIICFVAVVTIIPLLCTTRFGRDLHLQHERDLVARGLDRFAFLIDFSIRHARAVSCAGILLTVVLSAVSLTLRPDASTHENLPSNSSATQTLAHCDRAFGGIDFARVMVEWPPELDSQSPKILTAVQRAEALIAEEPLLRHPLSIRNFVVALAPSDANVDERMSLLDLVPPPLRRTVYNPSQHRALITVRVQDLGVAKYRAVFKRLEARLDELAEQMPGFRFKLSGLPVVEGQEIFQIVYDLATSLSTAGVVIFLVMSLAYRSLRIGLISIIPNVLPLAVTAMVLLLFGYPLSLTSVCAFVVCVGIAVDDTIHFLTRFLSECESGLSTSDALKTTFHAVGAALITTTLVLLTGFGSVQLSELPTHRLFSMMACCTIGAALVADLVILPAMLAWLYPRRRIV